MKTNAICAVFFFMLALLGLASVQMRAEEEPVESGTVSGTLSGPKEFSAAIVESLKVRCFAESRGKYTEAKCTAKVDNQGKFEITAPKGRYLFYLEAEGWCGQRTCNVPENVDLKLTPAGRVSVALEFGDLKPREVQARVYFRGLHGGGLWPHPDPTHQVALTDKPLLFESQVPHGEYELCISFADGMALVPEYRTFTVKDGQTTPLTVSYILQAKLTLIEEDGRYLGAESVSFVQNEKSLTRWPRLMKDGYAEYDGLLPGKYTLKIARKGYEVYAAEIVLEAEKKNVHAFTLKPSPDNRAVGQVIDDESKPVAGAVIRRSAKDPGVRTDAEGRFVYPEPTFNREDVGLEVVAPGYEIEELAKQKDGGYHAKLTRSCMVYGAITGAPGTLTPLLLSPLRPDGKPDSAFRLTGYSQADGRYYLTLRAGAKKRETPAAALVEVNHGSVRLQKTVEGLKTGSWHELNFELPEGASLKGKVIGRDGKPLTGARLELAGGRSTEPIKAECNDAGDYSFSALAAGIYGLSFASGLVALVVEKPEVRLGKTSKQTRDFDFSKASSVKFKATFQGSPLTSVSVLAKPGQPPMAQAIVRDFMNITPKDVLEFVGLPPGEYHLELTCASGTRGKGRLKVPNNKSEIIIEQDFGAERLRGKVKLPTGLDTSRREGWRVQVMKTFDTADVAAAIAADGSFEIPQLGAGKYRVIAMVPGFASAIAEVEVSGDQTLDFELEPAGALKLNTQIEQPGPATLWVNLHIWQDAKAYPKGLSLEFRDFQLKRGEVKAASESLPPGKYRASVTPVIGKNSVAMEFFRLDFVEFSVEAGAAHEWQVTMKPCAVIQLLDVNGVLTGTDMVFKDAEGKTVGRSLGMTRVGKKRLHRIADFPTGEFKLEVSLKGYKKYETTIKTEAGKTVEVTIELEKE